MARHIRVVAIARDQAWALPSHLQALADQHLADDVVVDFHLIHYGCADPTPAILHRFAARAPVRIIDGGAAADGPLAEMAQRCHLLNAAMEEAVGDGCDHVLYIHPAVRLPADGLRALLETGRPIVGGLACTDRFYDLPEAFREHNVFMLGASGHFEPVIGGVDGLQACDAVTHVYLLDRDALRAGVGHAPHPSGEDFGLARSAAAREIPRFALGSVRCAYAPGPEAHYFTADLLAQVLCPRGTIRLQARGNEYVVTLSARAVANTLASTLADNLPKSIPGAGNAVPATFHLNWNDRIAQVVLRAPPA